MIIYTTDYCFILQSAQDQPSPAFSRSFRIPYVRSTRKPPQMKPQVSAMATIADVFTILLPLVGSSSGRERLEPGGEVPQERRLVSQAITTDLLAALPNL